MNLITNLRLNVIRVMTMLGISESKNTSKRFLVILRSIDNYCVMEETGVRGQSLEGCPYVSPCNSSYAF